jgi:hypothetical protein
MRAWHDVSSTGTTGNTRNDIFVGRINLVPFIPVPIGFVPCDGRLVKNSEHQALFAAMGPRFGGDERKTFAGPKLDAPAPCLPYVMARTGFWPACN